MEVLGGPGSWSVSNQLSTPYRLPPGSQTNLSFIEQKLTSEALSLGSMATQTVTSLSFVAGIPKHPIEISHVLSLAQTLTLQSPNVGKLHP